MEVLVRAMEQDLPINAQKKGLNKRLADFDGGFLLDQTQLILRIFFHTINRGYQKLHNKKSTHF